MEMKSNHLRLRKFICGGLLISTFFMDMIPTIYVHAETEPSSGRATHGATQENNYDGNQAGLSREAVNRIIKNTPLTNEPYAFDLNDSGEKMVVFGSKAKTADSDVDLRYTTLSYQIEYKGQKVSIAAENLIGRKANGGVTAQYMGFREGDIAQALLNQGLVNSLDEGKDLVEEMFTS